jgi:hypothetical protein
VGIKVTSENLIHCLSTIKGVEAQLSSLALSSPVDEARRVFHETMMEMEDIKQDLQKRIAQIKAGDPQSRE